MVPWLGRLWRVLVHVCAGGVVLLGLLLCPGSPVSFLWFDPHGGQDPTRIQIKKMEEALLVFASKNRGRFPARLEEAKRYFPDGEIPVDAWGNPFLYVHPTATPYALVSLGADGKIGGEGQDADIVSYDMYPP